MSAKLSMICSKQSNGSYFAICPEIKSCYTQGDNYEDAAANLRELVEITLKEFSEDEIQDFLFSETKIFSEFVVAV